MRADNGSSSKSVFDIVAEKYDVDGDGRISESELSAMAYDLGYYLSPAEAARALASLDTDGDGYISQEELRVFWRTDARFAAMRLSDETEKRVYGFASYFRSFDVDDSGSLDSVELGNLHAALIATQGYEAIPRDFSTWRTALDSNDDGNVSFNEFVRHLVANKYV